MKIEIDESERQLILLALAQLSVERPGWDYALNLIACKMDNVDDGRGRMYDDFRGIRQNENPPTKWERITQSLPESEIPASSLVTEVSD